ncbi:GNAT family N-acetyltransferase [Streptomyces sp. NPDC059009]|uniref:GNAT family N-acetyltransferase n=1 Tax=Streptomyces sp. NPDC059009 TaxID=3346694 RepID=UPI0036CB047C
MTPATLTLHVDPTPSAPGLTLRPWRPDDVGALVAAHRDPQLRRWMVTGLEGEEDALRWIEEQEAGRVNGACFSFAVVEQTGGAGGRSEGAAGEGRPLGHVAVRVEPDRTRPGAASEVGYWVAPEARGRGIAARALDAASRWAFGSRLPTPPDRLELLHSVANHASCAVARKCGYTLDSVLPPFPPLFPAEGHLHVRRSTSITLA